MKTNINIESSQTKKENGIDVSITMKGELGKLFHGHYKEIFEVEEIELDLEKGFVINGCYQEIMNILNLFSNDITVMWVKTACHKLRSMIMDNYSHSGAVCFHYVVDKTN